MREYISLNGSKAVGKSTLAHSLSEAGYGNYAQFYLARYEFQRWYLPVFDPDVELSKWKRHTALLCFALDWHRRLKHLEGRFIFDHYYADYLVQQLSSLKELDVLLKFIEEYDLPSFSEGYHFFIDTDYETYMGRREKRLNEQPEYRRDLTLIEKNTFENRRQRYLELVDMGYLIRIDANHDAETVLCCVENILGGKLHAV